MRACSLLLFSLIYCSSLVLFGLQIGGLRFLMVFWFCRLGLCCSTLCCAVICCSFVSWWLYVYVWFLGFVNSVEYFVLYIVVLWFSCLVVMLGCLCLRGLFVFIMIVRLVVVVVCMLLCFAFGCFRFVCLVIDFGAVCLCFGMLVCCLG